MVSLLVDRLCCAVHHFILAAAGCGSHDEDSPLAHHSFTDTAMRGRGRANATMASPYPEPHRGAAEMTASTSDFAHTIRTFRLQAGLSQEELAERAGVSARAISDMERGL